MDTNFYLVVEMPLVVMNGGLHSVFRNRSVTEYGGQVSMVFDEVMSGDYPTQRFIWHDTTAVVRSQFPSHKKHITNRQINRLNNELWSYGAKDSSLRGIFHAENLTLISANDLTSGISSHHNAVKTTGDGCHFNQFFNQLLLWTHTRFL
jgi:hypothetical protein